MPLSTEQILEKQVLVPETRQEIFQGEIKKNDLHYALEFLLEEIEAFLDIFDGLPAREDDLS